MARSRQAQPHGCHAHGRSFATRQITKITRLQAKSTESPITRMFGGKFRSTLRVPHQKDSVLVEDWGSLRLDIQVCHLVLSVAA